MSKEDKLTDTTTNKSDPTNEDAILTRLEEKFKQYSNTTNTFEKYVEYMKRFIGRPSDHALFSPNGKLMNPSPESEYVGSNNNDFEDNNTN